MAEKHPADEECDQAEGCQDTGVAQTGNLLGKQHLPVGAHHVGHGVYVQDCAQPRRKLTFENEDGCQIEPKRQHHHRNFIEAVRTRKPVVEDPVFGFRAAGPALLSNKSYFEQRMCKWEPQTITLEG